MPKKKKEKDPFEFRPNVQLNNIARFCGDRSKPYRKSNGKFDKDSNHEPDWL